jgi:hypothetical protein
MGRLTRKDGSLPVTREMLAGGAAGLCQVRCSQMSSLKQLTDVVPICVSDHHHYADGAAENPASGCWASGGHTQGCWTGIIYIFPPVPNSTSESAKSKRNYVRLQHLNVGR